MIDSKLEIITKNIQSRKTIKGLANKPQPPIPCDKKLIKTLIESAYWAPFHKPCHQDYCKLSSTIVPWRFHVLDSDNCRKLALVLDKKGLNMGKTNSMLNSASYLIQATWTPDPSPNLGNNLFYANKENMEHIAAAGAAVQNLLLTANAMNLNCYWSSGDIFRNKDIFNYLKIPLNEILLGAIFIFPSKSDNSISFLSSKLRNKRGNLLDTYCFVSIKN